MISHIRTSDSIDQIATALALAQGMIEPADKDGKSHQAKYATLLSVRESSRLALAKNDLAIIQPPFFQDGRIGVLTRVMHKSGQWIESEISIRVMKEDAHSAGSAITYLRRYSMSAMLAIVSDDDDDGALAMQIGSIKPQDRKTMAQVPQGTAHSINKIFKRTDPEMVARVSDFLKNRGASHMENDLWIMIENRPAGVAIIQDAFNEISSRP